MDALPWAASWPVCRLRATRSGRRSWFRTRTTRTLWARWPRGCRWRSTRPTLGRPWRPQWRQARRAGAPQVLAPLLPLLPPPPPRRRTRPSPAWCASAACCTRPRTRTWPSSSRASSWRATCARRCGWLWTATAGPRVRRSCASQTLPRRRRRRRGTGRTWGSATSRCSWRQKRSWRRRSALRRRPRRWRRPRWRALRRGRRWARRP
mmetsp:Transcript_20607/g.66078  ORF Transcript_20607/g.66078 Transcript_20607/m.66078 type:complete len:207 (+) Transcript_20607:517-1137(+)